MHCTTTGCRLEISKFTRKSSETMPTRRWPYNIIIQRTRYTCSVLWAQPSPRAFIRILFSEMLNRGIVSGIYPHSACRDTRSYFKTLFYVPRRSISCRDEGLFFFFFCCQIRIPLSPRIFNRKSLPSR